MISRAQTEKIRDLRVGAERHGGVTGPLSDLLERFGFSDLTDATRDQLNEILASAGLESAPPIGTGLSPETQLRLTLRGAKASDESSPSAPGSEPVLHEDGTKTCPMCAEKVQGGALVCRFCGHRFDGTQQVLTEERPAPEGDGAKAKRKRLRVVAFAVLAVLLLGGAAAGYAINHNNEQETKKRHEAAQRQRRETEREKTEHEGQRHEQEATERKSAESELEKGVETYAKKLVSEGTLSEPVTGASCNPVSGGSSHELNSSSGTFSCIAITKHEAEGKVSGYRFSGTIDFATGKLSYRLGGGE
jgi:uncharacterized protein UPF0547